MSFTTYHSRIAAAERLLARDAHNPTVAGIHSARAEFAENQDRLLESQANEGLAPPNSTSVPLKGETRTVVSEAK